MNNINTNNIWENTEFAIGNTSALTFTEATTTDPWKEEVEFIHSIENHNEKDYIEQQQQQQQQHQEQQQQQQQSNTFTTFNPAINTPKKSVILDSDTTHKKGFQNSNDMDQILDLEVSGQLPDWFIGEHYTIGPGIYDVKFLRKVEIDGEIQHASGYFTFGHWFDTLPLVNRFDINGTKNTISYRNRLPNKRLIEKIRENHGYTPPHPASVFKTNSNQSIISKFMKSNAKASKPDAEICGQRILPSIPGIVGRLFAQNSAKHIQELDPFDLKPTRVFTWDEINPRFKGYSSCPNGHFDDHTGEYINFTMEVGYQTSQYHFFSITDREPQGNLITSITAPTAYVNSFAVTPKYIIFILPPMIASGMKYSWNESILDSFKFDAKGSNLFYVISREKKQVVAVYRSASFFSFHQINAYEDLNQRGHNVYIDMICYSDDTIAHQLATNSLRQPETMMKPSRLASSEVRQYCLSNIEDENLAYLSNQSSLPGNAGSSGISGRFTSAIGSVFRNNKQSIPKATATTTSSNSTNDTDFASPIYAWMPTASYSLRIQPSLELPQINPNYKMHNYKYMYGLGFSAASSIMDGQIWNSIVKTDISNKSIVASWHQDNCYPSEAVFIPRPSNGDHVQQEDDGVLVSVVMDSARATSFLLILDAITLHVLATADLNTLVPLSFAHGTYRLRN
ncbi:unnamed protein product [Cunninghamella echinulata]